VRWFVFAHQGLNVKIMKKDGVTIKMWDLSGQVAAREEWPRYAAGCSVIAFVVDTQEPRLLGEARKVRGLPCTLSLLRE